MRALSLNMDVPMHRVAVLGFIFVKIRSADGVPTGVPRSPYRMHFTKSGIQRRNQNRCTGVLIPGNALMGMLRGTCRAGEPSSKIIR